MALEAGKKIRTLRRLKGYSQEYMAYKLNLSQSAYGKIERGESDITLTRLEEIAKILERSPIEILLFDSEKILRQFSDLEKN